MELVTDSSHLIDTLRFQLHAACVLPQEDVRLTVRVSALLPSNERDPVKLEQRIRETLAKLVKADWTFTRITRQSDAGGYERIALLASCRTPPSENWDLAERARQVSGEGIAVTDGEVSYSLPADKIDAGVEALRMQLLARAGQQAERMSAASGRRWRVGDIEYGLATRPNEAARRTGKGAYVDEDVTLEMLANLDGQGGVTGGERISLTAAITLKAPVGEAPGALKAAA